MLAHDISHPLTSYLSCNFNCFCNHKLLVNSPQFNIIEHNVKRFFSISPWLSGSTQNYYEILELSDNSSRKDIKKAFARLSKLHHPDAVASRAAASGAVPPASTDKFLAINEAYQTLSNPVKRQEYDERLRFENRFSAYTTVRPPGSNPFSYQNHPRPHTAESEQFANRPFSFYQAQYMRPESFHGPPPSAAALQLEAFIQKRLFFIIGIAFVISSLFQYSRIRTYKWLQLASDRHRHLHLCKICEYGGSCVRESRVNIAPYNFMHYVEALLRTQQAARFAPDARASAGGDAQIQTQTQPKPSPETLEAARLRYEQELERLSARVLHVMHQRYFLVDAVEAMPSSPLVLEALDGTGASER